VSRTDTRIQVTYTKQPSGKTRSYPLDLQDLHWTRHGPLALRGFSPEARDLLELARAIHEIDRRSPPRQGADRIRALELHMSLRKPAVWTAALRDKLQKMLSLMSNIAWTVAFTRRQGTTMLDEKGPFEYLAVRPERVVLFSGGLDSASGLAQLKNRTKSAAKSTLLISYYTRNQAKQLQLADALGFPAPLQIQGQWRNESGARAGGQFWYRSWLFLTIAAVIATAHKTSEVLQFENGPLAWAVPPQPIYRMTRHAHPEFQQLAREILTAVLGQPLTVANPFLTATKRDAVKHLRDLASSRAEFAGIVALTESCWYLQSPNIQGSVKKTVGQPCGACIPCIVRRTALPNDEVPSAADLTSPKGRHAGNALVRVNVAAYRSLSATLSGKGYTWPQFLALVPPITERAWLMNTANVSAADAFALYRRFAQEFLETYDWDIPP
jgi:7-cyano-7-deazaguanine synthase in queuosine biosynthesis